MNCHVGACALLISLCSIITIHSFASNTSATFSGRVVDANSVPVANSTVTIEHVESNTTASAVTTANGSFYQGGLRVGGPYEIRVSAPDYQTYSESNVFLRAGAHLPRTISLQAAAEGVETLVVTASQDASDRDLNNGIGSAYSNEDITNQPATKRDVLRTVLRDPLAQSSGEGNLSVGGVNPRFNGLAIDGSLQQDDFGLGSNTYATSRSPINLDAIESVSLVASDYSVSATGFTGGLVNITTKSGSNNWDGSFFRYTQNPDMVGDKYAGDRSFDPGDFEEIEMGFTIGGPIVEDKLFFFLSIDEYESTQPTDFSSFDQSNGIQPGFFDALQQIIIDTYGYDPGSRSQVVSTPVTSERVLAKVDWNASELHRLAFTYQSTLEARTSASASRTSSAWIDVPVDLKSYTFQAFSDWSDTLSSTLRLNQKDFLRGQNCQAGPGVAAMEINDLSVNDVAGTPLEGLLTDQVSLIAGCDRFRHANAYEDERFQVYVAFDYLRGDHVYEFGYEYEHFELYNLFVPSSAGRIRFDGLDELLNRTARVDYVNTITNNAEDGAAQWGFSKHTFFLQDSWYLNPELEFTFGARLETYAQDDKPAYSASLFSQYGVDSSANLDGLKLFMPRLSFRWSARERTSVSGGFGLFAGGDPKVWTSNAFQVPTVFARLNGATNISVTSVPAELINQVGSATEGLPIDVLGDDFNVPADWKASLRVEQSLDIPWLGDNVIVTGQYLHTNTKDGFLWRNLAQTQLSDALPYGVAPDGRRIYADLDDLDHINLTQLANFSDGASDVYAIAVGNRFKNGIDVAFSYAYQDVNIVTEGFSSRGISNWRNISGSDRNFPDARKSPHEVTHSFKINLGYGRDFGAVGARVDLFGRSFSSDRFFYSYDISSSNSLFGRAGAGESPYDNSPLYVPASNSDPRVVYTSAFDVAAFFDYIASNDIDSGVQKGYDHNAGLNQIFDVRFQFDIPGIPQLKNFAGDNRIKLVLDIENVLNFLNSDWGTYESGPSRNQVPIVRADLISASDLAANGVDGASALTGDAPRTTCTSETACVYRYYDFDADTTSFVSSTRSIFRIRLGFRFDF